MIHNNEVISIEEDLLNCRQMIRRFTFNNRNNRLRIGVLTIGATLVSCELDSHEIVVNNVQQNSANHYSIGHESIPFSRTNWISHVRGTDTLSLTAGLSSSQSQSIVYQLTPDNQMIVIGRLKTQQQLFNPYFFNLNCATSKTSLEGHYLQVRSSDSSASIQQQITVNNMTNCTENELNFVAPNACAIPVTTDDSKELDFDAVYCLTSTDTPDAKLVVTLRFESRTVEVTIQNNGHQQTIQSPNGINLKLRVRITNGAVCMMPTLMNEFKCIYKFIW
ncbi:uncharacterized protein LOC128965409 [Oppia nitens]|uniref:uncharacterized protein LOC128965409 n=1 Tax=Oppia nitens TaxID=1686743 RepID=UPI0023DC14B4|nr:uncharacterized protein LOC128965409 [Oppia nitens]